ncbi:unnamed protein product [Sympodiomycopsis kandeliae]
MGNRKASLSKFFGGRRNKSSDAGGSTTNTSASSSSSGTSTPSVARSPSSASSSGPTMTPISPQPSSIPAKATMEGKNEQPSSSVMSSAAQPNVKVNGNTPVKPPTRPRGGSLSDRGAAVLRALARAPEDESPEGTPAGSSTPIKTSVIDTTAARSQASSGKDTNGYSPEGQAETSPRPPGDEYDASADVSRAGSIIGLSEAEKEKGRLNREGLRRRGEQREVEKALLGKTKRKSSGDIKKKSKSWEIPRKIFHSSIGFLVLYLYLSHHNLERIVSGLSIFLGIVITADVIRLNNADFEWLYEKVLGFLMREAEKEKVNGVVWYLVGVIFSLHFYPADIACVSVMMLSWADTCASVFGRLFGRYTPPLPSPPFATRKSLSGFIAAIVAGSCTAYLFWGTDIALKAERFDGVSWNKDHAVFGATAPGIYNSGWIDWSWGFRGKTPSPLADNAHHGSLNAAWDKASRAASQLAQTVKPTPVPGMPLPLLCIGSGLVAAIAEGLELGGVDDNLSLPILSGFGIWAWLFVWGHAAKWFIQYTSSGAVVTLA